MLNSSGQIIFFFCIVLLIMITLASFIIGFMFLYYKKQYYYLKEIEKINAEQETIILKAQMELQETILKNISREIHDNIGLTLSLSKLHLNSLHEQNSQLQTAIHLITKAINNLRNLSRTLNSDYVLSNGLLESIRKEIGYIKSSNAFEMSLETKGQAPYIESSKELLLFRIIQELFNNAIKHSQAKTIKTCISYATNEVKVFIHDDGKGFVYEENNKSFSGLNNVQNRVKLLDGSIEIQSKIDLGTQISISIPLNN